VTKQPIRTHRHQLQRTVRGLADLDLHLCPAPAYAAAGLRSGRHDRQRRLEQGAHGGYGPFVFSEWESGSHIIFTANPNWINPPKLEQVFIRIVPDDAAQEAAIIAGDTDIGVFLSSDQIETLEAGGTVDVSRCLPGMTKAGS
jgi:ABC-type transport system substrate-binding protein